MDNKDLSNLINILPLGFFKCKWKKQTLDDDTHESSFFFVFQDDMNLGKQNKKNVFFVVEKNKSIFLCVQKKTLKFTVINCHHGKQKNKKNT